MSSRRAPRRTCRLITLAVVSFFCAVGTHSAFGQVFPGLESTYTRPNSTPNPKTTHTRTPNKRPDGRPRRPSNSLPAPPDTRPDERQAAIEQAIEQGNQARDTHDYERALAHYQKARDLSPRDPRAFYGMGNLYSDLYCNDSAIEAYLGALKLKKDYVEALVALGYAYAGKERYDDAEEQFKAALTFKRDSVDAGIGLGSVEGKKGKYQEAMARLGLIVNSQSVEAKDRATAHVALGRVYWLQDDRQEAIAQFEKAVRLKHDYAIAYLELGHAQMTSAYSRLSTLGGGVIKEAGAQATAAFSASVKQAIANIEKAGEHGLNHPVYYEFLAQALAHQSNYQAAAAQLDIFFAKVKELEDHLSPLAKRCNYGFTLLKAHGHWNLGYIYDLESEAEVNEQRKAELVKKSIEQFKRAVELKQDFSTAYSMLGVIYTRQEKYEESIGQYKKALLFTTGDLYRASMYQSIAMSYSRSGRADEAISHAQEAIRLNPKKPSYYETLASIYIGQGKLEETLDLLHKATELRTEPSAGPGPYYYLGATYAVRFMKKKDEKDFTEAIRWLKKAVEIMPNNAMYHKALAATYGAHSDADEALASYKKAVGYDPKNLTYYVDMADVYSSLKGNEDAAIDLLKQAIGLKPDFAPAYRNLGLMYQRKKNYDEAARQLLKAVELDPKHLGAHLDLAYVYRVQKNYPEAVKYLQKAIETTPTNSEPYKDMARLYEAQQKTDEAVHYYEEAIKRLDADDTSSKNLYLGRIARLRGRFDEATAYFQKLAFPDSPGQTNYEIGLIHVASKNKRAALEQHQQLIQLKSALAEDLLIKIKEMK